MLRYGLITIAAAMLLFTAVVADADNGSAPRKTPPKSNLDVTMNVVPLNSDIEKTVVQTITLPVIIPTAELHKQGSKAKAGAVPSAAKETSKSGVDSIENTRASVLRQTAEAQREAAETAKEARKDLNNSSAPDNDTPPFR
ncbi:MAG TPA: hypothetical protein VNF48_06400 [Gammaproteobacteria bacterium]|nr:hypothetical protein [Gammaproteobacteria bacterium]